MHEILQKSLGASTFGFFGAGITGAGFSQLGISPFLHFALVTVFVSTLTILLFVKYNAAKPRRQSVVVKNKSFVWPSKGIFFVSVLFLFRQCLLRVQVLIGQ